MDPRRASSRMVIDPKVRQVGFFTPEGPPDPTQTSTTLTTITSTSPLLSPSGNSILCPVMIPPPLHFSDSNCKCVVGGGVCIVVGSSYNPSSPATEFSGSGRECLEKVGASLMPAGGLKCPRSLLSGMLVLVLVVSPLCRCSAVRVICLLNLGGCLAWG
ncbi:hypothetical protein ACET3Z_002195 [Daucus carota]